MNVFFIVEKSSILRRQDPAFLCVEYHVSRRFARSGTASDDACLEPLAPQYVQLVPFLEDASILASCNSVAWRFNH